jgi:hypothetical protein
LKMKVAFRVFLLGAIACAIVLGGLAQEAPGPAVAPAWRLDTDGKSPALFHAKPRRRGWVDVSPFALSQMAKETPDPSFFEQKCALCALDTNHAWVAINLGGRVVLEYTSSGGKHWVEKSGPPASEWVSISFLDDRQGFVLNASGSLGNHHERVYQTSDGGEHWKETASPTRDGSSYYADGIVFRTPLEGWITASYHGVPDAPLFHTEDGGKSWSLQVLPIPEAYRGGYATTYPPAFFGEKKMRGVRPVELAACRT